MEIILNGSYNSFNPGDSLINIFYKQINSLWGRQNLQKVIKNISWLTFERAINLIYGLVIGVWFARYLGPEQYGLYNYALSIIVLLTIFSGLGLNDIVIREIVKNPQQKYTYLGSAFGLTLISSIGAYLIAIAAVSILEPGNQVIRILVSIMGLQLLFTSFVTINTWFASQVESKKIVLVRAIALIVVSGLKIYLIINEAPLIYFAWLLGLGAALFSVLMIMVYRLSREDILKWNFRLDCAKALIKDSWPLILAGLSISVYMKTDQVMVGNMLGETALGYYSAAVKLSEVLYYVPMVIVPSFYPSIIKYKLVSENLYLKRLQLLYLLMTWLAIPIALVISFLSPLILNISFGFQYIAASEIFVLYTWAAIPVYLGVASNSYLMTENMTKISFYRSVLGAVVNIMLNWLLIPMIGLKGAAFATLISQSLTIVSLLFFNKARFQFILIVKSFLPWSFKKLLSKQ